MGATESVMKRYSPERKAVVLAKLLPPYNMTVTALAQQEGISEATLYTWRKQAKAEGKPVPAQTKKRGYGRKPGLLGGSPCIHFESPLTRDKVNFG
ncbi:hypothetical protein FCN80_21330 [Martelella alba]|uniref:Transposase n=1 Tax=Martelella alba TaxID=2590451 RepID=A0ABY2SFM9_9HYPH|nr:hypothetical protein FCN80_21330 [Martelella alba]